MPAFEHSTPWRVSTYERLLAQTGATTLSGSYTTLPTALLAELSQLERTRREEDVLEVVAACIRQGESALILLRHQELVWPLTLFPQRRSYHAPAQIVDTLHGPCHDLRVVGIEPPSLPPPGDWPREREGVALNYRPLAPLLWALAVHARHAELFADISGRAAYRLAAGFDVEACQASGALVAALRRLRSESAALIDIARWPGMDLSRATRLLNAIYLQGSLMVLRTHPQARGASSKVDRLRGWLRLPR